MKTTSTLLLATLIGLANTSLIAQTQQGGNGPRNTPPQNREARMIQQHDANNDGVLSGDELPPRMQQEKSSLDTNNDGSLDTKELANMQRLGRGPNNGQGNSNIVRNGQGRGPGNGRGQAQINNPSQRGAGQGQFNAQKPRNQGNTFGPQQGQRRQGVQQVNPTPQGRQFQNQANTGRGNGNGQGFQQGGNRSFAVMDANGDGVIDRTEWNQTRNQRGNATGQGQGYGRMQQGQNQVQGQGQGLGRGPGQGQGQGYGRGYGQGGNRQGPPQSR